MTSLDDEILGDVKLKNEIMATGLVADLGVPFDTIVMSLKRLSDHDKVVVEAKGMDLVVRSKDGVAADAASHRQPRVVEMALPTTITAARSTPRDEHNGWQDRAGDARRRPHRGFLRCL